MLKLWLCGRIGADWDGDPLVVPGGDRVRALLGLLALQPGPHDRSAVAARLWPAVPDASARASLRTVVWALRQAWGDVADRALLGTRTSIGLPRDVWVDALVELPDAEAVELCGGDLLPGVDDDWVRVARDEHRGSQLAALQRLADEAEAGGHVGEAVRWSRRRCALAPLDEAAHRDLLRRLLAAGEHASAAVGAREFSARLRDELGVRPSPQTRAAQSAVGSGRSTVAGAAPRPSVFGRADELRALAAEWTAAADGHGRVVVLSGEAGIGKTTLLTELARRVGAAGGRTAVGAGIDVGGETPFAAWLELARSLVSTVAPVPAQATWPAELSRLSTDLGARLGRPQDPAVVAAPELERLRVFEAVLRLVEWACSERPLLVAVDDAHRADRASLRLTAHIARRVPTMPTLLVLTRRDRPARAELDELLADLVGRGVPVTELEVGPIAERDVIALAASLSSAGPLTDAAIQHVVASAEGNPLLAVESARALATGSSAPPPNLRTAVRALVGRLPTSGRSVAAALAVAGRPLSRAELAALELPQQRDGEARATENGLLHWRGGRLGYRHALLREAAYADVPDVAWMHERVARAVDPADRAEVAHHLELAGCAAEAAGEWMAAAVGARDVGALKEAREFLVRACDSASGDGHLWLELQEVCAWLGAHEQMESAWQRAVQLLPRAELPAAWCRRGRQLRSVVCNPAASFAAYRAALELLDLPARGVDDAPDGVDETTVRVRSDALIGRAWGEAVAGDAAVVEELLDTAWQALQGLSKPPGAEAEADVAEIRLLSLVRQGRFLECADIARRAGPVAARAHLPGRAYSLWGNAASALACAGDLDGALELVERAVEDTVMASVLLAPVLAGQALVLARLGRHDEAATVVTRLRESVGRLDSPTYAATATYDAGVVALEAGRYDEAAGLLGEALDLDAPVSRPAAALSRAEALALAGRPDDAHQQLRAAILEPVGRADQPWALVPRVTRVQALVAAARGDRATALSRFDEAARGWRRLGASASGSAGRASDGYLAALVDLGRPPIDGLVEPARELARIEREVAGLDATIDLSSSDLPDPVAELRR